MKHLNFKRVFSILLTFFIFFLSINGVGARVITIDEFAEEFDDSSGIIDYYKQFEGYSNMASQLDKENNKFKIVNGSIELVSFDYTNDYIEYVDSSEITFESAQDQMLTTLFVSGVMKTIFNISGYEVSIPDIEIGENDLQKESDYQTYGVLMANEPYNIMENDSSIKGNYIRHFKMSFDTSKADAFIQKYGTGISQNSTGTQDDSAVLTLVANDITSSSVTLYPYFDSQAEDTVYCYIYRSNQEDEGFTKISNDAVDCSNGGHITDEGLSSSTKYYYKAVTTNGNKTSETINITTKMAESTADKNPGTGLFESTWIVLLVIVSVFVGIMIAYRKSAIKEI
jgi:hypothetical protein